MVPGKPAEPVVSPLRSKEAVEKAAKTKRERRHNLPTKNEMYFVGAWQGCNIEAAKAIGVGETSKSPEAALKNQKQFAWQAMKNPVVRRLLAEKAEAMAREAGKVLGRKLTKDDLLDEIISFARNPKINDQARARAYDLIAKMLPGAIIQTTVNFDGGRIDANKSPEEKWFCALKGRDPANAEELKAFVETKPWETVQ